MFVSLFTKIYSTVLVQIKSEKEILQKSPHKGLEHLTVGLKVQRSTDCASRALLHYRVRFRARLNWIVFVSLFTKINSTVLVQIKFEKEILQKSPHKGLEPLTVGLKVHRSID